jgi:predicted molibdopterin-dependent oxidoreductase YjgC
MTTGADEHLEHVRTDSDQRELTGSFIRDLLALKDIYGPDAIAGIVSRDISCEALYLFQKFFRVFLGTNNIMSVSGPEIPWDPCSDLYTSLGILPVNPSLQKLQHSNVVLAFNGTDISKDGKLLEFLNHCREQYGQKHLLIDPLDSPLSELADIHFKLPPCAEQDLLRSILWTIHLHGGTDREVIWRDNNGYQKLLKVLPSYSSEAVAERWKLSSDQINQTSLWFTRYKNVSVMLSGNTTPAYHANRNMRDVTNLMLATGHLGNGESGLFWFSDQINSLGTSVMGCSPGLAPGCVPVESEFGREWYSKCWQSPLPVKQEVTLLNLSEKIDTGDVKAIICLGDVCLDMTLGMQNGLKSFAGLELIAGAGRCMDSRFTYWWPIESLNSAQSLRISYDHQLCNQAQNSPARYFRDWELVSSWVKDFHPEIPQITHRDILTEMTATIPQFLELDLETMADGSDLTMNPFPEASSMLVSPDFQLQDFEQIKFFVPGDRESLSLAPNSCHVHFQEMSQNSSSIPAEFLRKFNAIITVMVSIQENTASKLGVSHGDSVRVETVNGTIYGLAALNNAIASETALIRFRQLDHILPILPLNGSVDSVKVYPGVRT